ncbi:MAG: YadA C-terminal domain-containing protein [Alphaproteobacteria bacterium]|nr:YadA C-terminal domain-containing protein [Alphaproteobacteria bacterium]
MRQSKTTIKELTAQYRAVLKHAFLAGIATFAVVSNAVADTTLTEPLSLATQIAEGSAPEYCDGSYTPSNWNSETYSFSDGEKATSEVTNPGDKPLATAQELELSTGSTTLGEYKLGYDIDNAAETPTAITVDVTTYSYEKTAATGGTATPTPLQSTDIVESPVLTKTGYDYEVNPTYYAGGASSVNIDIAPALTQYTFDGIEDGKTLANYVSYNSETQEYTSTFPDSLVVNGNAALTAYKEALVAYGNVLSNYNDANTKYNNAIQAYKDDQIAVNNAIESYRQSVGSWQASKTSFDNYTAAQTAKNTYDNSLAGAIDTRANDAITTSLTGDSEGTIGAALAGKQNALSTEQLAAANSGIDLEKVAQIATNTNAIDTLKGDAETEGSVAYAVKVETDRATGVEGTRVAGNYYSATDTLADADNKIDAQVKTNADAIATNTSAIAILKGDAETEGSVAYAVKVETDRATGVEGTRVAGNYYSATDTLADADNKIDAQVKTNADAIVTLNGGVGKEGSVANSIYNLAGSAKYSDELTLSGAISANTEAINDLSQNMIAADAKLRNEINALDSKVNELDENLSAGIASSVALSSVAVANVQRGEMSVGAGYGNYNSKSAVAFGAALGITDNWSANAGVGLGFGKDTKASFRVGTNYKFKLF